MATAIEFSVVWCIGFLVKLTHIPINNMTAGLGDASSIPFSS